MGRDRPRSGRVGQWGRSAVPHFHHPLPGRRGSIATRPRPIGCGPSPRRDRLVRHWPRNARRGSHASPTPGRVRSRARIAGRRHAVRRPPRSRPAGCSRRSPDSSRGMAPGDESGSPDRAGVSGGSTARLPARSCGCEIPALERSLVSSPDYVPVLFEIQIYLLPRSDPNFPTLLAFGELSLPIKGGNAGAPPPSPAAFPSPHPARPSRAGVPPGRAGSRRSGPTARPPRRSAPLAGPG